MKPLRFWSAAAAGLVFAVGPVSAANHVDALGRQWLPLTAVRDYSWAEIDGICQSASEAPGACVGSLGSVNLTGWTWASRAEVVALIGEFMTAAGDPAPPSTVTTPGQGYGTNAYAWAPAITAAMGITAAPLGSYTYGFTNGAPGNFAWVCHGSPCGWTSYAAANESYGGKSIYYGGWFHQAAPVPEPSSVVLMSAGAALLLGVQRRRAMRS